MTDTRNMLLWLSMVVKVWVVTMPLVVLLRIIDCKMRLRMISESFAHVALIT